jgi:two-component system, NtrC family, response regulator
LRELRNLIERAAILARGARIEAGDLPWRAGADGGTTPAGSLPDTIDLPATIAALERDLVRRALVAAGGVQAEAARRLGISRSLLAYKLKALGLISGPKGVVKDF